MECLEDRTLFSAGPLAAAVPLEFNALHVADVEHFLSSPAEFDLYQVTLAAGQSIEAGISAQDAGNQAGVTFPFTFPGFAYQGTSALSSLLRVFNSNGTPLALDDQQGGDPYLTFQAAASGTYYIGVSSDPNDNYNPNVAGSGTPGGTTGLYTLGVRVLTTTPLMPDMAGSSFRTGSDMAATGDAVPVRFTVENRGGADPGNFEVEVLLADSNIFGATSQILATFQRSQLLAGGNGRDFLSPSGFSVTVPAGIASGPMYLGLRIVADPAVPEAGLYDKNGVHRGVDWEPLTVVTSAPAGATDLSAVDAGIDTESTGTASPSQDSVYSFTVSNSLGTGEITAEAATTCGTLVPRLTLAGPTGQVLIQSDSGELVQSLQPGTYLLSVAAAAGTGTYRLDTKFVQTSDPPLATGDGPVSVAVADLTGAGTPDIIVANRVDQTVSVYLGNGDGSFQRPLTFAAGPRIWRVTVDDVVNDGKPAIITGNKGNNTVSILLGNGDGTFQPQIVVPAGTRVNGAFTADLTGDGVPDLIEDNYAADTVWVLPGNGNGTFGPPTIYSAEMNGQFQGPNGPTVADLSGDGIPDLIYGTYVGGTVVVRRGLGNGTFGPPEVYAAEPGCYAVDAVDLTGDGKPDLVAVNAVGNSVSVLLNNGNGTFAPQTVYPVGTNPYSMAVADVNGDGTPDIITSSRDDNTVSVLLGNGDGTFQPQLTFQTGKTPRRVAVGDFTGDGILDLVTANEGDNTATTLMGNGDGTFATGTAAAPAPDLRPFQVAIADLTGNGRLDVVTANRSDNSVSVLLANPDGSFQTKETYPTGREPFSVAVADLAGDGIMDIVTANYAGDSVSVLMGNGDGTFQPPVNYPAGSADYDVIVADLAGDGKEDLVVTDKNDNTVDVLMGNGNGTFQPAVAYPVASGPYEVVASDLTGNGILDLVVSHFSATVVDVLMGNGDGTFQPAREFDVGSRPYGLAVADLTGDGIPDIITANYRSSDVSILMGDGNGNFGPPVLLPVGLAPNEVQVADLTGDGDLDIITANYGGNSISVLMGNGNGSFQPAQSFPAGTGPASLAVADLTGNGKLDVVVGNRTGDTINILMGNGDGTFQAPVPLSIGENKYSVAVADLTGDGKEDIITTNLLENTVSVQLGNGDGTFEPAQSFAVGPAPTSEAVADLNGDGRPDLITANSAGDSLSVLLGNGDGTFQAAQTIPVGRSPRKVVAAVLTGDGIEDLVVTNYNDDTVSVLLGNGDGTFQPEEVYPVGEKPYGVAVADVTGDGIPDIIVANSGSDTVSVLMGNGNGTFQPQQTFAVGRQPFSVAVADLTGNGKLDIVTANAADNTVSVLMGNGNGTFGPQTVVPVGDRPYSVAVADLTGDGEPDLITTNYGDNTVSVLLGNGNGTFQPQRTFTTDQQPVQTVAVDVNGDGRPDLVTVNNYDSSVGVLLGNGDGTFQPLTAASSVGLVDTPFEVDLTGDGIADTVILDRSGNILYRQGLPDSEGFAPPVIFNPGRPARDIAIVNTGDGYAVAAADASFDPALSTSQFVYDLSLYTVNASGAIHRTTAFSTTELPVRLAAADLTGDGLDDLIVANSLDNSVTIAFQTAPGQFGSPLTRPVGITPSAIAVADVTSDGLPDVIVSDQASGDVTVLLNDGGSFDQALRFRAGTQPDSLSMASGSPVVSSVAQTVSVVAGDFTGDGQTDLVVVNRGAHSFTVLPADGAEGFGPPEEALTTSTSGGGTINDQPGAVVAGDFDRNGRLDLAVLMQDTGQVWIYTNNGNGTFTHTFTIAVGEDATGLSVVPGSAPGLLDLLVGNGFGDILHLVGKGDGTFQITGNRVSLSVVPNLLGNGQAGVLVGNQQENQVTIQTTTGANQLATVQTLGGQGTQLAPGDVQWAVLEQGSTLPDAIVVSSGSNAVIVYRTTGIHNGVLSFAPPQTLFVGTAPAGVTVADVNGDGIPDLLVANRGSNDVSVIFGSQSAAGNWVGIPGPRLKSGGDGPVAVNLRLLAGNTVPNLVVTNGDSGTITALPGVGQGFFDDQHPLTLFDLGSAVAAPPTFVSTTGLGYAVTVTGSLVRFNLDNLTAGVRTVYTAADVLAARALDNGDVLVAVAGGAVKILAPVGDGLRVAADLQTQGGLPIVPSALEVVSTSTGLSEVLVSSVGSSAVFVFTPAAVSPGPIATPLGQLTALPFTASVALVGVLTNISSISVGSAGSASAVAASGAAAPGLSLGGVATSVTNVATATGNATDLVAVQGNTYATVALLGLASPVGDEPAPARRPDLANRFPLGDASPLWHFLSGQTDVLRQYRGAAGDEAPLTDPWHEDLFQRPLLPPRAPEPPQPSMQELDDEAAGPGSGLDTALSASTALTDALAILLAATLLPPPRSTDETRQ